MLTGIIREAEISPCGRYRWTLRRTWDKALPVLLVVMFNPSRADGLDDDPTIRLVCQIASHNGYGGIVVVNAVPLRSSSPESAIRLALQWENPLHHEDPATVCVVQLQRNLEVIRAELARAGDVLLGYGALGARCPSWMTVVIEAMIEALTDSQTVYCLGTTKDGHPLHPLARGKMKVRPNAKLIPWSDR
jgi:hypothetical protein